jgi:hypothetical protein
LLEVQSWAGPERVWKRAGGRALGLDAHVSGYCFPGLEHGPEGAGEGRVSGEEIVVDGLEMDLGAAEMAETRIGKHRGSGGGEIAGGLEEGEVEGIGGLQRGEPSERRAIGGAEPGIREEVEAVVAGASVELTGLQDGEGVPTNAALSGGNGAGVEDTADEGWIAIGSEEEMGGEEGVRGR